MSGDDFGLAFFTQDEPEEEANKPSVFAPVNQEEMVARIDSTSEDDMSSGFFGDSVQEVEDAAVRMFDIGIRTITDDPVAQGPGAFGTPTPRASAPAAAAPLSVVPDLLTDPAARARFILGGPNGLSSRG